MKKGHSKRYKKVLGEMLELGDQHGRRVGRPDAPPDAAELAVLNLLEFIESRDQELRGRNSDAARRALQRIESGEFGKCVECGQRISLKRLAALPWAERCLRCQRRFESMEITRRAA